MLEVPMQRGMANVSGRAVGDLRGHTSWGRRRGATLLDERGGRSQLSAQPGGSGLGGMGTSKQSVRSGGAGVLGGVFQHENLLIQVLDFSQHHPLLAPQVRFPFLNEVLEQNLAGSKLTRRVSLGPQVGLETSQNAVGPLKFAP
jgi:hypothetical protein